MATLASALAILALLDRIGRRLPPGAPEPNAAALALAGGLGMRPLFETARMWRGAAPRESHARSCGVATLELG